MKMFSAGKVKSANGGSEKTRCILPILENRVHNRIVYFLIVSKLDRKKISDFDSHKHSD